MEISEKEKKAKAFVLTFKKQFFEKFGATPKVEYQLQRIPMEDIELACSCVLNKVGNQIYPDGIRTQWTDAELRLFRQVFYYLAIRYGHEGMRASRFLKNSGPVAGYSSEKIKELIKSGNEKVIRVTAKVKEELSLRYSQVF